MTSNLGSARIQELAGEGYKAMKNAGLEMTIADDGLDLLAEAGFDPVYGARPLKRAIQQNIENPLAQKILAGDFEPGDTVNIDVEDGVFNFNP
jgi:ATP-dependent Clp protease ATP-binding subunit ClpB